MNDLSTTSTPVPGASETTRAAPITTATDRYAALHRQLEGGRSDDELLTQLIGACIQLGKRDEAVQLFERVQALPVRRGLRRDLARHGWVSAEVDAAEKEDLRVAEEGEPTLGDRYGDALQHMTDGPMPMMAIGGTIAFPLVLALGGFLAGIHDSWPFRALAALPALLLVGIVGAIGRRVLLTAMQGLQDADDLPPFETFRRETPIVVAQLLAVFGVFFGPAALCVHLGNWVPALVLLPVGLYLLPVVGTLLLVTSDWRVLRPEQIFAAARAGGGPYLRTVLATLPLAVPGVIAFLLTEHLPIYTVLAVVGPLSVAPGWAAARVFGLYFHRHAAAFARWRLPTETGVAFPAPRWSKAPAAAAAT